MKFNGQFIKLKKFVCLLLYYGFAQYLPDSYCSIKFIGNLSNAIRVFFCKRIFFKCGHIRTINRKVQFGSGRFIEMGDESGIGARTQLPANTIIGNHSMIGRDSFILESNHRFDRIDIPINDQGSLPPKQTVIEDDVWIGVRCIFTPGRNVKKGTIIGMGSVVTKDFPEYSIIGGAPAKLIRSRLDQV